MFRWPTRFFLLFFRMGLPGLTVAAVVFLLLWQGPVAGEVTVVGGLTRELVVQPGETREGTITLRNAVAAPVEVKIYQTDYLFKADGRSYYGPPGKLPRSNASWISLSHDAVTIPPKTEAIITYTINVPKKNGLAGTYWSIVMVESAGKPPEVAATKARTVPVPIRHRMRYGVQVVTHIGQTGRTMIKFLRKELLKKEGRRVLQVDIENTGERWIVPEVSVQLFNHEGKQAGWFKARKKRIFPGTSIRHEFDLSKVPAGKYAGVIYVDGGDEAVFGARIKLKL